MLATREYDPKPPTARPTGWSSWSIGDKISAVCVALWFACWIAAVVIVAIR